MFSSFKMKPKVTEGFTTRNSFKHDTAKFEKIRKAEYGLNTKQLRTIKAQQLEEYEKDEAIRQDVAISKVHSFMDAIVMIVRIQSWYRMKKFQHLFIQYRRNNKAVRGRFFRAFKQLIGSRRMRYNILIGKPFWAWKAELEDDKRLKFLVVQFFQMSIQRLKLTPQAVMCFFASSQFDAEAITAADLAKIRRLILKKLFDGWARQVRLTKALLFKASQIISRMMRRTKGGMWSKEGLLVCFHVWHRYAAVKNAQRGGEPDPLFPQPILPQWNLLYRQIMNQRVHRRKTAENGRKLVIIRMFRMWQHVMTLDRTQAMNPTTKADYHYAASISRKVIAAWFAYLRERGTNVRRRDKCFRAWAKFAPSNRRFRNLTGEICIWLVRNRLKKAYNVMKGSCYAVIGKRATALRLIRHNICNRKLLVAAYALAGQTAHVYMLDCWRRWQLWWRARWRWKNTNWQMQLVWFQAKARAIILAWRAVVVEQQAARAAVPRRRSNLQGDVLMANKKVPIEDDDVTMVERLFPNITPAALDLFERAQQNILEARPDNEAFRMFCLAIVRSRAEIELNREKMDQSIAEKCLNMDDLLMEEASKEQFALLEEQNKHRIYLAKQLKLQKALDTLDLPNALRAIEEGAEVQTSHVRQAAQHVGDELVSMLGSLLRTGVYYIAERIARRDRKQEVFQCYSPLSGLLLSTHLERWERRDITQRELNSLTYGRSISNSVSSEFQTYVMWRMAALMMLKKKADILQMQCKVLDQGRTVDEEVVQVLLRQRITRLRKNREGLKETLGMPNLTAGGSYPSGLPTLVRGSVFSLQGREKGSLTDWAKGLDIYALLKEYTTLTGRLTREARALRVPMLERDENLLRNGFLKQSRADYLVLKRFCMTDAQKQATDAKKAKAEKVAAVVAVKKAKKQAKNVSVGLHNSNLLTLLTARDGEALLSEQSDYLAEKVFAQRCSQYKNLIVESWIARSGKKEKDENICNTYINQRRKEAASIFARLLKLTQDMCYSTQNGASSKNLLKEAPSSGSFLPDPNSLSSTGYSGFIWVNALKSLELSAAANNSAGPNGLILTSITKEPPAIAPETTSLLRLFFKWMPNEWWDLSRLHVIIGQEISGLSIVCTGMEHRIKKIDVSNKAKMREKNSYLSFLKAGRREILGIGAKINQVFLSDAALYKKNYAQIGKINRKISKETKMIKGLHETIAKCDLYLRTGRVGDMFRMLEIKFGDMDTPEMLNYKAFAVIDERKGWIEDHKEKIIQLEAKKVSAVADLKSATALSAQGKSYLSDHANERFSVLFNVQTLVSRLLREKKELEAEKLSESFSKKILKCYLSVLQDLNCLITDGQVAKKQHHNKDKKKKVKKVREDSDDDSDEESRRSSDSDSSDDFSMSEPSQAASDAESAGDADGALDNENSGFALNSDTDSDDSDDSDAIGFGRGGAHDPGYDRKSSLTEGEKLDLANRQAELAIQKATLDKAQESRMRVFDEYWLSLGDDGRKTKKQKKFFFQKTDKTKKTDNMELMPMMRRSTGVGGVAPRTTGRITKIWNAVSNRSLNARKPSKRKVRDSRYNVEEASAGAAGIAEVPQLTDVNFMSNEEYYTMTEDCDFMWQRPIDDAIASVTAIVPRDADDEIIVTIPDWYELPGPANEDDFVKGRKKAEAKCSRRESQDDLLKPSNSYSLDQSEGSHSVGHATVSVSSSSLVAQRRKAQKKRINAANPNNGISSDTTVTTKAIAAPIAKNDPMVKAAQDMKSVFVKQTAKRDSRKSSLSTLLSKSTSEEVVSGRFARFKSNLSPVTASPVGPGTMDSQHFDPVQMEGLVNGGNATEAVLSRVASPLPGAIETVVMDGSVEGTIVTPDVVTVHPVPSASSHPVQDMQVVNGDGAEIAAVPSGNFIEDGASVLAPGCSTSPKPNATEQSGITIDAPLQSPAFKVSPHSVDSLPLTKPPQIMVDDAILDEIMEDTPSLDVDTDTQLPFPISFIRVTQTPLKSRPGVASQLKSPGSVDVQNASNSHRSQSPSNSVNSRCQLVTSPTNSITSRNSNAISKTLSSEMSSQVSMISRKSNVPNIDMVAPVPNPLNPTEQKVNVDVTFGQNSIGALSDRSAFDDSLFSQDEESLDGTTSPHLAVDHVPIISYNNKITPNTALSAANTFQAKRSRTNGFSATFVNGQWMLGCPAAVSGADQHPQDFQVVGAPMSPTRNIVTNEDNYQEESIPFGPEEEDAEGGLTAEGEPVRGTTLIERLGLSVADAEDNDDKSLEVEVDQVENEPSRNKSQGRVDHPGFLPPKHPTRSLSKGPTLADTVQTQWREMDKDETPVAVQESEHVQSLLFPPKTTTTIVTAGVSTFGIVAKKTKTEVVPQEVPMDSKLYPKRVVAAANLIERRIASAKKVTVPKVDQSHARRVSSAKKLRMERTVSYREMSPIRTATTSSANRSSSAADVRPKSKSSRKSFPAQECRRSLTAGQKLSPLKRQRSSSEFEKAFNNAHRRSTVGDRKLQSETIDFNIGLESSPELESNASLYEIPIDKENTMPIEDPPPEDKEVHADMVNQNTSYVNGKSFFDGVVMSPEEFDDEALVRPCVKLPKHALLPTDVPKPSFCIGLLPHLLDDEEEAELQRKANPRKDKGSGAAVGIPKTSQSVINANSIKPPISSRGVSLKNQRQQSDGDLRKQRNNRYPSAPSSAPSSTEMASKSVPVFMKYRDMMGDNDSSDDDSSVMNLAYGAISRFHSGVVAAADVNSEGFSGIVGRSVSAGSGTPSREEILPETDARSMFVRGLTAGSMISRATSDASLYSDLPVPSYHVPSLDPVTPGVKADTTLYESPDAVGTSVGHSPDAIDTFEPVGKSKTLAEFVAGNSRYSGLALAHSSHRAAIDPNEAVDSHHFHHYCAAPIDMAPHSTRSRAESPTHTHMVNVPEVSQMVDTEIISPSDDELSLGTLKTGGSDGKLQQPQLSLEIDMDSFPEVKSSRLKSSRALLKQQQQQQQQSSTEPSNTIPSPHKYTVPHLRGMSDVSAGSYHGIDRPIEDELRLMLDPVKARADVYNAGMDQVEKDTNGLYIGNIRSLKQLRKSRRVVHNSPTTSAPFSVAMAPEHVGSVPLVPSTAAVDQSLQLRGATPGHTRRKKPPVTKAALDNTAALVATYSKSVDRTSSGKSSEGNSVISAFVIKGGSLEEGISDHDSTVSAMSTDTFHYSLTGGSYVNRAVASRNNTYGGSRSESTTHETEPLNLLSARQSNN